MIIGLCGNIGGGKSLIASYLQEFGAAVIDADALSRELSAPGGLAYEAMKETFGKEYFLPTGELDRRALGSLIFADPSAREKINALLHPLIMAEARRRAEKYLAEGYKAVVLEAALLIETGLTHWVDTVWLVEAGDDLLLKRIMARDGIDEDAARLRLKSQKPNPEQREGADLVIINDGDMQELKIKVKKAFDDLLAGKNVFSLNREK